MEDDDDAMVLDLDSSSSFVADSADTADAEPGAEVGIAALKRSTEACMVSMEPYFLKSQIRGAEECRNGDTALSALIGKVKGWLEDGKVSAVPNRIRHAFLHVRDYAKTHGGSLQIDFIQTIKPP